MIILAAKCMRISLPSNQGGIKSALLGAMAEKTKLRIDSVVEKVR